MFIEFLSKLKLFVERKGSTYIENCLIILDNASTHSSQKSIQYLQSNGFNVAYTCLYSWIFSNREILLKIETHCNEKIKSKDSKLAIRWSSKSYWRHDPNNIKGRYKEIMVCICKRGKVLNRESAWNNLMIIILTFIV